MTFKVGDKVQYAMIDSAEVREVVGVWRGLLWLSDGEGQQPFTARANGYALYTEPPAVDEKWVLISPLGNATSAYATVRASSSGYVVYDYTDTGPIVRTTEDFTKHFKRTAEDK